VIVIHNGHRDFVCASRNKSLQLRYLCRLFAKELVYHNFPGYGLDRLLKRMIELTLHTEEHLRQAAGPCFFAFQRERPGPRMGDG
jgi:hypothetical protein